MDWISRLQKVIEYIELHLTEDGELKLNMLAKQTYSSEYEFQKIFSIVTGINVGEYIRNRKLALSGEEILLSDKAILDIALKYGYETAESFTKAFTRFHGATPSAVRRKSASLKLYNKLSIHLQVDGGSSLDYRIIDHCCVRVIAKTKVFQTQSIEDRQEIIPKQLEEWAAEGMYHILDSVKDVTTYFADSILGIHDDVGCKPGGSEFRMSVGVESVKDAVPDGFEIVVIPAGKWLVFECKGMRPKAIQKLWNQIYTNFLPHSSYHIKEFGTLEVCREGFRNAEDVTSELWLPLDKVEQKLTRFQD